MKILKFAFVILVMVIGLSSCQKDDEPKDDSKSVAGIWVGKYGFDAETPSLYEKWDMETDGDLRSLLPDGTVYAVGSWDQEGSEIEVHYNELGEPFNFTFKGTYDEDNEEITGNWFDTEDPTYGGTFEMQRQ